MPDLVCDALTEHHSDNIRIGARAIRQDRGIHHAQPGQTVHVAILIHHCQRIRHRPHLAGAADVVHRGDVAQEPLVQGIVGSEVSFRGLVEGIHDSAKCLVAGQL